MDPLDGTLDFLQKTGEFSIMVSLVSGGESILGIVYKPVGDKFYFAEKDKGSFLVEKNKALRRLKVSKVSNLSNARYLPSRNHFSELEKKLIEAENNIKYTFMGSFGVKVGVIAEGRAEIIVNPSGKTSQWDIAAPEIILREAGGEITDMDGRKFIYNRKETKNLNGVVISNKILHEKLLGRVHKLL
jgi:3'(2'), 5'-bisphosphate nucleotidase